MQVNENVNIKKTIGALLKHKFKGRGGLIRLGADAGIDPTTLRNYLKGGNPQNLLYIKAITDCADRHKVEVIYER